MPRKPLSPETRRLYEKVVATLPGDVERAGKVAPYAIVNGEMLCFLTKWGELALRLPLKDRNRFKKKYGLPKRCVIGGIEQKEYVHVPDALLAGTAELAKWFAIGHAWALKSKS